MNHKTVIYLLSALLMLNLFTTGTTAGETEKSTEVVLNQWLAAGPVEIPFPVFENTQEKEFTIKDLLAFHHIEITGLWPEQNSLLVWSASKQLKWNPLQPESGRLELAANPSKMPQLYYLATYLEAMRWVKAKLNLASDLPFKVFLDNESLAIEASTSDTVENKLTQEIELETGKHLLLLKTIIPSLYHGKPNIQARIKIQDDFGPGALAQSVSPVHDMDIRTLLDVPDISGVSISADGKIAAVTIKRQIVGENKSESWIELYRLPENKLLTTYRGGMKISGVKWEPVGRQFAYTSTDDKKSMLWVVDPDKGTTLPLLENVDNLSGFTWSPTGKFIIYSIQEEQKNEDQQLKRIETPRDRWPWWSKKSFLYRVNVPEGTRSRLTAGKLSTSLEGISPDGNRLLFTKEIEDYSERPYSKTILFNLNLNDLSLDTVWQGRWFSSAQWSPDGKQILLTGGPSMFGELGQNVSGDKIPNEYDDQAYLMNLADGRVKPLTRDFNPTISSAFWNDEGKIYFHTIDRSYRSLYRYSVKSGKYRKINSSVDFIRSVKIANKAPVAIIYGGGAAQPDRTYVLDLKKNKSVLLRDPAESDFKNVTLPKTEHWNFVNDRRDTISGRFYFPPNFDSSKKYPCIVYYYGGTNPVGRDFGGRYPKNYWAANGYVVYVLQPSGAVGFGQDFSALHVNDWGKIVSQDIIKGVTEFADAHAFIDRNRIGAIGASYGGFMTMLLDSRTNIFAAAVSHAGISSISGYWGEGYWGFLYSAIATANSFPWNRKDIYIEQSPIFSADKINTPLLLLHGSGDTNVPTGESTQLFTALKLLGKPVEYIQIPDANHWVVDYKQRKIWTKTIMAWFDKWLKNQPEWWNNLYPEK